MFVHFESKVECQNGLYSFVNKSSMFNGLSCISYKMRKSAFHAFIIALLFLLVEICEWKVTQLMKTRLQLVE